MGFNLVKIGTIVLIVIFFVNIVSASSLAFLNFYQDPNSNENKVSYEINLDGSVQDNDILSVNLIINNSQEHEICRKIISRSNKNVLFEKHTCVLPKSLGYGKYEFEATLQRRVDVFEREVSIVFVNEKVQADMIFEEVDEGTRIIINVEDVGGEQNEKLRVVHDIPSEVIEYLDKDNKDDYIISDKEFAIIENYPLIAWSVDKAPAKINYTIKKNISVEDRKKFNVVIEKDNYFGYLSYFIFFMILIVLYFILRPAASKIRKSKK